MCGFTGFLRTGAGSASELSATAEAMARALAHRGPDDSGVWVDAGCGVALGHRRLAIIDVSPAGHQPMLSAGGRYVLAFNGEIYNHLALRAELQEAGYATAWRGHSDTETLLAAFERWGVESTLSRTTGMFALALWDRHERTLALARDRFGEKPLYYGWTGAAGARAFVFGSELKALRSYPGFANGVCRNALSDFMRFAYIPAPRSIHQDIYKLEPGCLLRIRGTEADRPASGALRAPAARGGLTLTRWWSLQDVALAASASPIHDSREALDELERRLSEAVSMQSVADVPLGAFLSGGVDSSTVVALMQKMSSRRVRTFTVGFDEAGFDESVHAAAVASHLGTEHTRLTVSFDDAQALIPRLSRMYDEPFADSSQIPTHLICAAARHHVTVALSGDGGDELFGGYNRYFWGPRIWSRARHLPHVVRTAIAATLTAVPPQVLEAGSHPFNRILGRRGVTRPGEKLHKLGRTLRGARNMRDLYLNLISEWRDPASVVLGAARTRSPLQSAIDDPAPFDWEHGHQLNMMFYDSVSYLPDDILCKVDRAAMAASLETRVPFLDHRVAELTWRMPAALKLHGAQGKWALRQILYRHVPPDLVERPKSGFTIPVGQWLRGPLRSWAEELLDTNRLACSGYLRPEPVRSRWLEHLSGRHDHTASLWTVLMFQSWLEETT